MVPTTRYHYCNYDFSSLHPISYCHDFGYIQHITIGNDESYFTGFNKGAFVNDLHSSQ